MHADATCYEPVCGAHGHQKDLQRRERDTYIYIYMYDHRVVCHLSQDFDLDLHNFNFPGSL